MKKLGILIFARYNSKRLPGKVLKEIFLEKKLIEVIYLRLKKFTNLDIVVCTSSSKKDDQIVKICKQLKIRFFRGNLKNVFDRTIKCLKKFKFDAFVRINADRPFVDFYEVNKMVKIFKKNEFDIITNQLSKKCPKGLACEVASAEVFFSTVIRGWSRMSPASPAIEPDRVHGNVHAAGGAGDRTIAS